MKLIHTRLCALTLAISGTAYCLVGSASENSSVNTQLETRIIQEQEVTVFIADHGARITIQVSIIQPRGSVPIRYDEVEVTAYSNEDELTVEPVIPNPIIYGQLPSNAVGAYKAVLKQGQKLTHVIVKRGSSTGTFFVK